MVKLSTLTLLACIMSTSPTFTLSQDAALASTFFMLGDATFTGTGCASHDVLVRLSSTSERKDLLRVAFAQPFRAQSGSIKAMRARATCNGVISITPRIGYAIGFTEKRVAGFVSVPNNDVGSYAQVTTIAFFAGGQGPKTQKRFDNAGAGPFAVEDDAGALTIWSKCGVASSLRINTALLTNGPEVTIEFESPEQHGLLYSVSFKSCTSEP